jgi:cell division protein FtsW
MSRPDGQPLRDTGNPLRSRIARWGLDEPDYEPPGRGDRHPAGRYGRASVWPSQDTVERERVTRRSDRSSLSRTGYAVSTPTGLRRDTHEPDYLALISVVALAAIGILMVYSASAIPAYRRSQNTFDMVAPQVLAGLLGVAAMLVLMRVDYRRLRQVSVPLMVVAVVLLVLVLVPGIGVIHNGARRWLRIGPLEVHPAEIAKLALVIYLAHWLAVRGKRVRSVRDGTIPFLVMVGVVVALVVREPDLGTATVIGLASFAVFFVAGANLLHAAAGLAAAACAGGAFILVLGDYPIRRILAFIDPWSDPAGTGYHTIRGLEALAAGGLFGTGLGNDRISVPNDFNDFIFSVIAQQLGLAGGAVVIGLFMLFGVAGLRTALRAPDTFGGLLAAGITAWICLQAFINIGVVLAVVPVTGITLPFVSAGGSSLAVSFAAAGILLSISRETVEVGSWHASADRGRGYGRTYLPGSRGGSFAPSDSGCS